MQDKLKERLYMAARTTVLILVVIAAVYWYVNRPQPIPASTTYIGNPNNACVYPEDSPKLKELNWSNQWEEFSNLEAAKRAGYRLCH